MLAECLEGLRVLDLTVYIPGPFCTQWLSDLGAEVVKVEPPAGDPMRAGGPVEADGTTAFYKLANRNKTVVVCDLKSEDGKRQFAELVARADVLVEAYRPGVLARLGFGPERLDELNPRLIHCAISSWGQTGPHAARAGHDLNYVALSGALWSTGSAERPAIPFPPLADHAGAMTALAAILAALVRRGHTGKGARLDIGLSEAVQGWMGAILTEARRGAAEGRGAGHISGGAAYYNVYRCRDGKFLAVAAIEEKFWRAFCGAVGRPDWLDRQADPIPQIALAGEMAALFATRDRDEWAALLGPVDCCVDPVLEPGEVPHHPQARARGLIQDHEDGLVEVLLPMMMDQARAAPRRPFQDRAIQDVIEDWR